MRIHHLNCGSFCPVGGALMDGTSGGLTGKLACHCLLVETDSHGLVLVDTGLGLEDVHHPRQRLSSVYMTMLNIRLDPAETAVRQIEALGFSAADVRHVVLTHLDFDHAGGLSDFPGAVVHVLEPELQAARYRQGFVGRRRYRPQQWAHVGDRWRPYRAGGEPWFGFESVRDLEGLPPEILMVPLVGHTWGHGGVAVRRAGGSAGAEWLLHAGDAYFYHGEVGSTERRCTPGLDGYQRLMEVDHEQRMHNQERLRRLSIEQRRTVDLFCAHDVTEFQAMAAGQPPR